MYHSRYFVLVRSSRLKNMKKYDTKLTMKNINVDGTRLRLIPLFRDIVMETINANTKTNVYNLYLVLPVIFVITVEKAVKPAAKNSPCIINA